jgi:hypothetical protein
MTQLNYEFFDVGRLLLDFFSAYVQPLVCLLEALSELFRDVFFDFLDYLLGSWKKTIFDGPGVQL